MKRKKKQIKKALSKLEDSKAGEVAEAHEDGGEEERIVRKSTRTAVINRQAERDAIRAALQATMRVCFPNSDSLHVKLKLIIRNASL